MAVNQTVSDRIDDLAGLIVRKYDPTKQANVLIEEMSELTKVLCKLQRDIPCRDELNEEFTHVLVSCEVIRRVMGIRDEAVLDEVERKLRKYGAGNDEIRKALSYGPEGDPAVLSFIDGIYESQPKENAEAIQALFHNGYCYYFAHMLRRAFSRGTVCLAYPFGHVVWLDEDGVAYDVEGVSCSEYEKLIDIDCIPELKHDFMHVDGMRSPMDIRQRVEAIIKDHPAYVKWPPTAEATT